MCVSVCVRVCARAGEETGFTSFWGRPGGSGNVANVCDCGRECVNVWITPFFMLKSGCTVTLAVPMRSSVAGPKRGIVVGLGGCV